MIPDCRIIVHFAPCPDMAMRVDFQPDVISDNLTQLYEGLDRLQHDRPDAAFPPWIANDIRALDLQLVVEVAVDIAHHLITENNWRSPREPREAFATLHQQDVLDTTTTNNMNAMLRLHDIPVQAFEQLDDHIVRHIAHVHADDFCRFADRIKELTAGS